MRRFRKFFIHQRGGAKGRTGGGGIADFAKTANCLTDNYLGFYLDGAVWKTYVFHTPQEADQACLSELRRLRRAIRFFIHPEHRTVKDLSDRICMTYNEKDIHVQNWGAPLHDPAGATRRALSPWGALATIARLRARGGRWIERYDNNSPVGESL